LLCLLALALPKHELPLLTATARPSPRLMTPATTTALRSPVLMAAAAAPKPPRPEVPLQATAFIFVLGLSLVTLTPTTRFIDALGQQRGMAALTAIAATSAAAEIAISPVIGGLSDSIGRKGVLIGTLTTALLVNAACAFFPALLPIIGASKFVSSCVIGVFFLAAGASLADNYRLEPTKLAASSGVLFALVNLGFGLGIALSALLPPGLRVRYAASAAAIGAALATVVSTVRESLLPSSRVAFQPFTSFNPFAFVRLLCVGRSMRLLACLAALNVLPLFMGDTLQAFAIGTWKLSPPQVSKLFTFVAVSGVLANTLGGTIVKRIGIKAFTALSTASSLLMWCGFASASLPAALACSAIGFLGPARTLGASTIMSSEGAKLGIPQGRLAGDRANLIAWIKVIGPLVYGQIYLKGVSTNVPQAPFYLNIFFTAAALLLGPFALSAAADDGSSKAQKRR